MLDIAKVGPGEHVIDLGSGHGRIVLTAARRFGATGLGVEIVPDLVTLSLRSTREAGVADKVSFREQHLFKTDLSAATVITMYLLTEANLQLRPALLALKPGTLIVSHDWDMGDWKPDRTTVVAVPDKKVGLEKSSKVHFWVVPAQGAGLWCGTLSVNLQQRYQEVRGTLLTAGRSLPVDGRMEGRVLRSMRSGASTACPSPTTATGCAWPTRKHSTSRCCTPTTPDALRAVEILDRILRDEIGHVAIGNRWYRWLCERDGLDPVAHYRVLYRQYEAPRLRAPFNLEARSRAGFTDEELDALSCN